MESNVIVWDLETTPNLPAAARALGLSERPEDEIREELGEKFPKLPLHKIVCIGALIASRVGEGWQVDALGAPHLGQRTEGDLIRDFVSRIESLRPQLVTFNGSSFDLPVLRYRAMINRIAASGLSARPYFHRHYDDAIDLCDVLGSFQSQARTKLDELAKVLDLDGKPTGIKGGNVEEMVAAGGINEGRVVLRDRRFEHISDLAEVPTLPGGRYRRKSLSGARSRPPTSSRAESRPTRIFELTKAASIDLALPLLAATSATTATSPLCQWVIPCRRPWV